MFAIVNFKFYLNFLVGYVLWWTILENFPFEKYRHPKNLNRYSHRFFPGFSNKDVLRSFLKIIFIYMLMKSFLVNAPSLIGWLNDHKIQLPIHPIVTKCSGFTYFMEKSTFTFWNGIYHQWTLLLNQLRISLIK